MRHLMAMHGSKLESFPIYKQMLPMGLVYKICCATMLYSVNHSLSVSYRRFIMSIHRTLHNRQLETVVTPHWYALYLNYLNSVFPISISPKYEFQSTKPWEQSRLSSREAYLDARPVRTWISPAVLFKSTDLPGWYSRYFVSVCD